MNVYTLENNRTNKQISVSAEFCEVIEKNLFSFGVFRKEDNLKTVHAMYNTYEWSLFEVDFKGHNIYDAKGFLTGYVLKDSIK